MPNIELPIWAYAYGQPTSTGRIRTVAADFMVTEQLAFTPSGAGEHVFLLIEKQGENTEFVARQLARLAKVRQRDIGYAGLKDRHALTRQWFSVWLPGKSGNEPDWTQLNTEQLRVLQTVRHARKLKRGVLAGNHFTIIIRNWQGEREPTQAKLVTIKSHGCPNYYGEQRFGHGGQNVNQALAMFQGAKTGREQRSLYLSAARSFLFNQLLAYRVNDHSWNQAVAGDTYVFALGRSCFKSTQPDADILRRVAAGEIHPTATLFGTGNADVTEAALHIEQTLLARYPVLTAGLLACAVERDRRALRVNVADLNWQFKEDVLELSFTLPAGSYATAVLRELVNYAD